MTDMISESAKRLFAQHPVMPGCNDAEWNPALWQAIEEAGFPLALLSEDEGGFDLDVQDAFGLLQIAAANSASLPLGETMLANWLLARAGLPLAEGPAGITVPDSPASIPYGRHLKTLIVAAGQGQASTISLHDLASDETGWQKGANLAGEPRDTLLACAVKVSAERATMQLSAATLEALRALLRVQQMAGALQAVLDMSVKYAGERVQFGRPIGKFQAIQQYLAVMAGEAAAANAAATMSAQAFPRVFKDQEKFRLIVAAAKIRSGEAAGIVASLSHQVHGAIGFSREYSLHPLTRRLWSWRDEYGGEADWAGEFGRAAFVQETGFWPFITKLQAEFF
ncbi:acyl-CoA dehydrogenase [Brucellaceae bacterium VT-16-1752]|nr:acyl-CoA dehydrogenase [Brucellaceae bacterium VT-16-1752]